jgi:hypothetical protein
MVNCDERRLDHYVNTRLKASVHLPLEEGVEQRRDGMNQLLEGAAALVDTVFYPCAELVIRGAPGSYNARSAITLVHDPHPLCVGMSYPSQKLSRAAG